MRKNNLISVIIPFYKELDLIETAVNSAVSQRLPPGFQIEIIIGNDSGFSENKIRSMLSENSNKYTKIFQNNEKRGAGGARNTAINKSNGNILTFLDADDYWIENKIFNQLVHIKSGKNFVAGGYLFKDTKNTVLPPIKINSTLDLLCNTNVGTSTVVLTYELLGDDRFNHLKFSQDTELWARLAGKPTYSYGALRELCTVYAPSLRTSNKLLQFMKFRQVVKIFNISPVNKIKIYFRYIVRGILNHYLKS